MELGPLSIKKWDAGEKNGEIGQFLAELVFWLSCKISFFTISNHTNGAAELRLRIHPFSLPFQGLTLETNIIET